MCEGSLKLGQWLQVSVWLSQLLVTTLSPFLLSSVRIQRAFFIALYCAIRVIEVGEPGGLTPPSPTQPNSSYLHLCTSIYESSIVWCRGQEELLWVFPEKRIVEQKKFIFRRTFLYYTRISISGKSLVGMKDWILNRIQNLQWKIKSKLRPL